MFIGDEISLYDIPSSFLQHHISKADIALLSAFPAACVSHPESAFMTCIFVAQVMFLSFQIFESVEVDVLVLVVS